MMDLEEFLMKALPIELLFAGFITYNTTKLLHTFIDTIKIKNMQDKKIEYTVCGKQPKTTNQIEFKGEKQSRDFAYINLDKKEYQISQSLIHDRKNFELVFNIPGQLVYGKLDKGTLFKILSQYKSSKFQESIQTQNQQEPTIQNQDKQNPDSQKEEPQKN